MAFEVISEEKLSQNEVKNAVKDNALKFFGTLNYGKAGVMMIKNTEKNGIVKVNNKFVNHLKGSMILINNINNKKVIFKINKVSGILNKLKEAE